MNNEDYILHLLGELKKKDDKIVALERAINGLCWTCIHAEKAFPELPDSSAFTCDSMRKRNIKGVSGRGGKNCPEWQFDEARFSTDGDGK